MSFIEDHQIRDKLDTTDLVRMNIGRRWWKCALSSIPDGLVHKETISKFINKIGDHIRNGRGLLFYGELSTGKSGSAVIVAKAVVCYGGTAFFIPMPELSDQKIERRIFEDEVTVWQRMIDVDLLILDDVGAEKESSWARSLFERIVRIRSNSCKSTIYTTNRFEAFEDIYDNSTIAIIQSTSLPVLVEGKNWREQEELDLKKEILG